MVINLILSFFLNYFKKRYNLGKLINIILCMLKFFKVAKDEEYDEITENEENIEETEEIGQIALDILETKDEMILIAPIAGVELEDIDLLFDNNVLTIVGDRKVPLYYNANATLRNSECFWWKFSRNVILPENLDFDSIRASLENSILIVTIPKLKFASQNITIEKV